MSKDTQNPIVKYFAEFGVLKDCGKNFWLTNVIQFFDGLGYFTMILILALFYKNYCGFTDANATFWVGMYTLLMSMFVLAVGSICDIIGLRRTYAIGFSILITGRIIMGMGTDWGRDLFGMAQADSSYIVIAGIVLMAFGTSFMSPCITTSVRRFTTLKSRATGFNFYYLFMNIGAILAGVAIVDPLREAFDATTGLLYVINVGTACHAIAFVFTRFIQDDFYAVPEERVTKNAAQTKSPLTLIGEVIRERAFQKLVLFLVLTLGVRLVFTLQFLVMPQYYTRTVGDDFQLGLIGSINPTIIVLGLIAIIPILNRFKTVDLMIYGMSISAFSLVFMAVPAEWYLVLPGIETMSQAYFIAIVLQIVIFAFGELLFSPRFSEYVARVAPKDKVASYMSLAGLPMFIAKPFNGVLGGLLVSYLCYNGIAAKIDTGHVGFWQSPEFMWAIYLIVALVSPIAIIATKSMFTAAVAETTPSKDDADDKSDKDSTEAAQQA